jgi:hypothetical protein
MVIATKDRHKNCPYLMGDVVSNVFESSFCGRPVQDGGRDIEGKPACLMHSYDPNKDAGRFQEEFERILVAAGEGSADFTGFVFPTSGYTSRSFIAKCRFVDAIFIQRTTFAFSKFAQTADFSRGRFNQEAIFASTFFSRGAAFVGAKFVQAALSPVAPSWGALIFFILALEKQPNLTKRSSLESRGTLRSPPRSFAGQFLKSPSGLFSTRLTWDVRSFIIVMFLESTFPT